MHYEWIGGCVASTYRDHYVAGRDKLADYAFNGRFDQALECIEDGNIPNSWRLRKPEDTRPPSGWTTLHQAAMLSTSTVSHIERLVSLGAYRNLRTMDTNETAYDIAKKHHRSREILDALKPHYERRLDEQTIKNLQKGLDEVVMSRVASLIEEHRFRIPTIEVLLELPGLSIWCPIPGFYGGFNIELREDNTIETESSCRVAGGSEQTHVIQPDGTWKITASGY
ncbi:uncharacterized protein DFL_004714 [Arthrobotrys flagrans]|uniref:Uncharacterized protein n=1 Tax=Arthrobotrys flagrans TaxID=97331 RepID=A0A437A5K1_ARTFL|nr:hypothetical protein DFL_004714 [Arthrobotrys flagrans]